MCREDWGLRGMREWRDWAMWKSWIRVRLKVLGEHQEKCMCVNDKAAVAASMGCKHIYMVELRRESSLEVSPRRP